MAKQQRRETLLVYEATYTTGSAQHLLDALVEFSKEHDLAACQVEVESYGQIELYRYRPETDAEEADREGTQREWRRRQYDTFRQEFEGEVP